MKLGTKRKLVYWGVLLGIPWALAALACGAAALLRLPPRIWGVFLSPVTMSGVLSSQLARTVLRHAGLSLKGSATEMLRDAGKAGPASSRDPASVPAPTRTNAPLVIGLLLMGAAIVMIAFRAGAGPWALGAVAAATLGGTLPLVRPMLGRGRRSFTADAEGIRVPVGAAGEQVVRWEEIARCKVETQTDDLGGSYQICTAHDRDGRQVAWIPLAGVPPDARRRFLDAIRGEPAPAELIAAGAPAGRGTELSAATQRGTPDLGLAAELPDEQQQPAPRERDA